MTVRVATENPNFGWFDKFTIAHVSAGALLAFTGLPWWAVLGGAVVFELIEPRMQAFFPQWRLSSTRETAQNSVADIAVAMAAWWLVRRV